MSLPTRELGRSGLHVSAVGLGCMGMSFGYGDRSALRREDMVALIREAFTTHGVNFFDTAEFYGPYENEALLGEAFATLPREKLVIATKCGLAMKDGVQVVDSRPETIRASLAGSLERLRTTYVDLYYIHRVDPKVPIETVAQTMLELKKEGKIRHWGLSEASAATVRKAHAVFPLAAVQNEYSLMCRDVETQLVPTLEELGVGLVSFSPLGRAFLTAAIKVEELPETDFRRHALPRFTEENRAANQPLVDLAAEWAQKKQCTPAQFALAWVLAQKPYVVPIPGTTKLARLEENIAAVKIELTAAELAEIRAKLDSIKVHGERFSAAFNTIQK